SLGAGAVGGALSIGVSLGRNEIASVIEGSISNASLVKATTGGITVEASDRSTIRAITAAAGVAAAGGLVGVSLSGAGADATNTILTQTRAFTLDSKLKSATDVHVTATGAASIDALVIAFSAAIALGAGALAVSIGISLAQNLIGWNPAAYDA